MSLALWSFERKCSETAVGLELLFCLSTGLRCSLKRSLSRRLVSPMHCLCNDCIHKYLSTRFVLKAICEGNKTGAERELTFTLNSVSV